MPLLATEGDFKQFVEPCWPAMSKLAKHFSPPGTWEDVLQEAMTTAWRKRHQYDPARGTASSWLLAIVADRCCKHRRRKTFGEQQLIEAAEECAVAPAHHDEHSRRLDVKRAVGTLAPRQRQAVVLFYLVDLSQKEVTDVMHRSVETVKSTLSQAKHQLARILGKDYHHV